jgi:pimeloyl-ACP methyl ester carboxylesterase
MDTWTANERAGLGNTGGYVQKLISVPLDKGNPNAGTFDLFYFVPDFKNKTKKFPRRNLLFCLGGPGRVLKPHDQLWFRDLSLNGYNIVYFHLRGSGFSQLPASAEQDRYLRTKYAADDLEEIRKDYLVGDDGRLKQWDAVIGYSYGAVLAQQYAKQYPRAFQKLLLIGPISLDAFVDIEGAAAAAVYENYEKEVEKIRISVINKIYDLQIFKTELELDATKKNNIKNALFNSANGIFAKIDRSFGSEQSVINNYDVLSKKGKNGKSALEEEDLNYKPEFFQSLRDLHLYGRRTDNDGLVNQESKLGEIGEVIARALGALQPQAFIVKDVGIITNAPRSKRVFDVMGIYDGINKRFIKEWIINGRQDVAKCVKLSSGTAWNQIPDYDREVKRIAITQQAGEIPIKPWSPADYPHDKSTIILKGSADPVTAAGQAESYNKIGIVGSQSILVNFDGVGHEFILPGVKVDFEGIDEILHGRNADPLNCLVYAFVEHDFNTFKRIGQQIWKQLSGEESLPILTFKPG